jgi:hypothetical protein
MPKGSILQEGQSYTFRSYFEMVYEPEEILDEFGYSFSKSRLSLPQTIRQIDQLPALRQRIERILPLVSLTSETARRETLVAPVLMEVAAYCNCLLKIEYPLTVNSWLKGNFDYLLRSTRSLLVVEAKNDDLTRGFIQLAVELIALSMVEDQEVLYGAVTIGDVWQFGRLDSKQQRITQDITLYRVPDDLDVLMQILVGTIEGA